MAKESATVRAEGGRRQEILKKAAQVFLQHGYEATSMNLVAEEAAVTKPGLYYHFKSKQELLFSILSYAMDILERTTREAMVSAESSEDRLRRMVYAHARIITQENERALTVLVIDETQFLAPDDQRLITHRKRSYFELVRATLDQLAKEGKLRDANRTVATFSLLGMIMWISKWYRPDGALDDEEVARQVTELALCAVLRDDRRESLPGPGRPDP